MNILTNLKTAEVKSFLGQTSYFHPFRYERFGFPVVEFIILLHVQQRSFYCPYSSFRASASDYLQPIYLSSSKIRQKKQNNNNKKQKQKQKKKKINK